MGTNTGIGIGIGIPFKNNALGGDRPYLPPELKARLIGVWDNYGKKNTDADRNIIKNKIPNAGGDLEILNSAYKLNSGFGEYKVDFLDWTINSPFINERTSFTFSSFNDTNNDIITVYQRVPAVVQSFKIKTKLRGRVLYRYYVNKGDTISVSYYEVKEGINILPDSVDPTSVNGKAGFVLKGLSSIKVEQIPSFEGAFVTDGINDLITSTKTVQEMLGGSNEMTIISLIGVLSGDSENKAFINTIYPDASSFIRNTVANADNGKLGCFGYSISNINNYIPNSVVINNILGDKNDYIVQGGGTSIIEGKLSVVGRHYNNGSFSWQCQAAWYWTIIANKVLTTDQINQVIAYFNLDRTLKPDIYCNIAKQGITNENHAEFGDKLIDYSGNGRDIQLNNIAWKGDSGIGKYVEDFTTWYGATGVLQTFSKIEVTDGFKHNWVINRRSGESAINSFKVLIKGIPENGYIQYRYFESEDATKKSSIDIYEDGEYSLPNSTLNNLNDLVGFQLFAKIPPLDSQSFIGLTITQIPSHAGALCLDGINDFGKVTGMPIYKDYTFIIDYERISYASSKRWVAGVVSKSHVANQGAFILMTANTTVEPGKQAYSFGGVTLFNRDDFTRALVYQSKYKCGDVDLTVGEGVDSNTLWLGTFRDNDQRFFNGAIYSLMSFPYSMSEFLIERQLKKHKLGTLYPDMVEFRPIVKSNSEYQVVDCYIDTLPAVVGNYYPINSKLRIAVTTKGAADEVTSLTVNGVSLGTPSVNGNRFTFNGTLSDKSPQKINITIDEYIRFEDIVQPYPVLLRFKDENGNEVSWGGKFRVGSTITRIGSAADSNLLPNIYNIFGLLLNGNQVTSSKVIVEKTMVFKAKSAYIFDNNEPNCILSPRLLRIPNSSYKILGHIPDISGHGNNGKINNSAYAEGSGVNEDGSYQFDGVDDFVTIPTTVGGKQVLMKVNWQSDVGAVTLYDQRLNISDYEFAIYNGTRDLDDNPVMAYQGRNNGQTYIDGILNSNIMASELKAITHNITITNELSLGINNTYPVIGSTRSNTHFAQMSLYDFMLFDEISTDDKIKELNEYVGVEAKVELPPYYWDAYGKTNLDADKATIQQRGVAVGDYDITNYNHAYEGMSGYNGYPVVFGIGKTYGGMPNADDFAYTVSPTTINVTKFNITHGFIYSYLKRNGELETQNLDYPSYKIKVTGLEKGFGLHYSYLKNPSDANLSAFGIGTDGIYTIPKSFASDGSLINNNVWIGFIFTGTAPESCNVTIEVLPEYENGLAYDAITDYSKNVNIPMFDDFTAIMKRKWLKNQGCPLIKGSKVYEGGNGNALLLEWDKAYNFVFYKRTDIMEGELPDNISFITPTNYNGNVITRGSEQDTNGICIAGDGNAGFANMVFYKLILYPKTIPLLQINFLKNLMERDEIIDLNNPIFIKNE